DLPDGVRELVRRRGDARAARQRLRVRRFQRVRQLRGPVHRELQAAAEEAVMLTTLDRMFLVSFFRSYAIVWTSLISLYVVIDLFTNIDDFGKQGGGLRSVVDHVVSYYGHKVAQIFDLMAEAITLMAAMFSVAWLQRNNELLPQLSAG